MKLASFDKNRIDAPLDLAIDRTYINLLRDVSFSSDMQLLGLFSSIILHIGV
jgi:hypothetical protein